MCCVTGYYGYLCYEVQSREKGHQVLQLSCGRIDLPAPPKTSLQADPQRGHYAGADGEWHSAHQIPPQSFPIIIPGPGEGADGQPAEPPQPPVPEQPGDHLLQPRARKFLPGTHPRYAGCRGKGQTLVLHIHLCRCFHLEECPCVQSVRTSWAHVPHGNVSGISLLCHSFSAVVQYQQIPLPSGTGLNLLSIALFLGSSL